MMIAEAIKRIVWYLPFSVLCLTALVSMSSLALADAIKKAEAWFANVTTLSADFTQVASDGSAAVGSILMRRPSRMKITYHKSPPLNIITTPVWLHVDQPDDRLVTSYPISETPLSLILADPVSLRPNGYKTNVIDSADGIVQIVVSKDSGEGAGRLTLEFTEHPFQLRRWVVEDIADVQTSVTLQNLIFGLPVENNEFKLPRYTNK